MNPLHVLGVYGKDNSSQILDAFKEYNPEFDLGQKDAKGNSSKLFFSSYLKGIRC
jgi:hypothetical protein